MKQKYEFFKLGLYAIFSKKCILNCKADDFTEFSLGFNIKNLGNYTLQGICLIKDNLFITGYDATRENNSKIFIYTKDGMRVHETLLNTKSHVGGIAYDARHKLVWLTDTKGTISGYRYEDVMTLKKVKPVYEKIKVNNKYPNIYGNNSSSFLTLYKNRIYVGNYNKENKSYIVSYQVLKDGNISLKNPKVIKSIDFIQGIYFFTKNKKTYLVTSSSFILKKSLINIYEYKGGKTLGKKVLSFKVKPMLEQIIYSKGFLFAVYESNSIKYQKYKIHTNDIVRYNIKKLLK